MSGSEAPTLRVIEAGTAFPLLNGAPEAPAPVQGNLSELPAAVRRARGEWPVALVSMPFVSLRHPSLQLGLLKALGDSHGFPVETFHFSLDFGRQLGPRLYGALAEHRGYLLGDWLFSRAAFGDAAPDPEGRFIERFRPWLDAVLAEFGDTRECLIALRDDAIPDYLDRLMAATDWGGFRLVGFTSTFQQNAASIALARRIKERFPQVATLFGGANLEGEMGLELVRSVPAIDYAVIGEGDRAFPELLIALQEGTDPARVPGVACRRGGEVVSTPPRPPFHEMDELPPPDYTEFFERAERLGVRPPAKASRWQIPFESARGCWWGERSHCTFCGLNGQGMVYRSKSPERVAGELAELSRRHRSFDFFAVDNILDMEYLDGLFGGLAKEGAGYRFFYELKANLTREQIRALRDGGVREIQPGIESLSTPVLKRMRKGITAVQNVNTLRWARYYGLQVNWAILWGFPGEAVDDYRRQLGLIRLLTHLEPPVGNTRIWMERFSPVFTDPVSYPVRYRRPEASYAFVYPAGVDLERLAYFFDYEFEDTLPDAVYEPTRREVQYWRAAWDGPEPPTLTFRSSPGYLEIEDRRVPGEALTHEFTGLEARVYAACSDRPQTAARLAEEGSAGGEQHEIARALNGFYARGLMMKEGRAFLSLALPAVDGR